MATTAEDDANTIEETSLKNTKYIIINNSTKHKPPHIVDLSRKLLCIEYPGIVNNVDKMIETLGGMRAIELTVGNPNRRLELRFRSEDMFSKSCWGDRHLTSGILVKISRKEPKNQASNSKNDQESCTYHYEVIGVTSMTFKFSRLCDFQYLPLVPMCKKEEPNTPCKNVYQNIIPKSLPDLKWFQSSESHSMPLFLPPPLFTKFNCSKENKLYYERYKYYEKVMPKIAERLKKDSEKKRKGPKNVITHARLRRKANSIFVAFNLKDPIPTEPNAEALAVIKRKGLSKEPFEAIKRLFEERPIWSKSAMLAKSGVANDRLKIILPGVAYHFPNGPWRVMWCKFGYDPRTDPSSRIYQTFDYRVRSSDGLKVKVQAKRSYSSSVLYYKAGPVNTNRFSLKDYDPVVKSNPRRVVKENHYILKPNVLPPARQMFYQYCDLHLPEIQDMLKRLPEVPKHATCHYKDGWLPNGFHDQCREIANEYIKIIVRRMLIEEKESRDEEKIDIPEREVEKVVESAPQKETVLEMDTIVIDEEEEDSEAESGNSGDEDDVNLKAVDEINKIIGNIADGDSEEGKDDFDEELDPELINLYHNLIDPK